MKSINIKAVYSYLLLLSSLTLLPGPSVNAQTKCSSKELTAKIEFYYDCGKESFEKERYPLSVAYFRRAIGLEKGQAGLYTPFANEYIKIAKDRIKRKKSSPPANARKEMGPKSIINQKTKPEPEYIICVDDVLQIIIWQSPRIGENKQYIIGKGDNLRIAVLQKKITPKREKYTIDIGDTLHISVYQNNDLTRDVTVRPDGMIAFPLAGDIPAAGLTMTELDKELTKKLQEFVKYADVSISYIGTSIKSESAKNLDCDITVRPDGMVSFPYINDIQAAGLTIPQLDRALTRRLERYFKNIDISVSLLSVSKIDTSNYFGYFQNFDQQIIVRPDEKISFPYIGDIKAAGLTIPQLDKELTKSLKKFYKYYEASVMLKKMSGNRVIVLGEVVDPNVYEIKGTQSLLETIALAGDFTKDAVTSSVILIRNGFTKPSGMRLNLARAIKKADMSQNVIVRPGDIIYVPRTFIANVNYYVNQIISPIAQGVGLYSSVTGIINTRWNTKVERESYKEMKRDWKIKKEHEKDYEEDREWEMEVRQHQREQWEKEGD